MKYMKKIMVIILALALISQPVSRKQSSAAINNGISTQSLTTTSMSAVMHIDSDGVTKCTAYVLGKPGTTKIAGTLKLKKGTTVIKSWNISSNGQRLDVHKTCYLLSKGTYKLELKVKVTCNGKTETLSVSHTGTY